MKVRSSSKRPQKILQKFNSSSNDPLSDNWLYLVKWNNYPESQSTWQPESKIKGFEHLIKIFQKDHETSLKWNQQMPDIELELAEKAKKATKSRKTKLKKNQSSQIKKQKDSVSVDSYCQQENLLPQIKYKNIGNDFIILGLFRDLTGSFHYKIEQNSIISVVDRQQVIRSNPLTLIEFYQQKLILAKWKPKDDEG